MVRVPAVDAHHHAGTNILGDPQTFPYGERQYSVLDIGGDIWTFSQSVADIDPSSWGGNGQ
jgi:uncharacterized glyoxalase superfamily protein PhnB